MSPMVNERLRFYAPQPTQPTQPTMLENGTTGRVRLFEALGEGATMLTVLCLPNEDVGKRNSRLGVCFRGTLRGCEHSIWATNARTITRKDTPDLLFRFPTSSFGEHTFHVASINGAISEPLLNDDQEHT